jgi:predicted nucleic acid-binding protein/antitoxin (DNA-binding transcriptional repressor) of toxin-antitoxin stability system
MRSKEIMDAVERGQFFTVTRDGRPIGELVPPRGRPRLPRPHAPHQISTSLRSEPTRRRPTIRARLTPMSAEHRQGLLDTDVLILRRRIASESLPAEVAISAVTLAELSAGVHLVRGDDAAARAERVRRTDVQPRHRVADLMIAAVAAAQGLPLYTANPDDFAGLDRIVEVVPVQCRAGHRNLDASRGGGRVLAAGRSCILGAKGVE